MMKNFFFAGALLCASLPALPCTSLLAGKMATVDGSTMITYSADSHTLFGELYYRPAAKYDTGAMRSVYDWDSGKFLGKIAEAAETFQVNGSMNAHQVSITESTWGGRPELVDTTGLIDYGSLIMIALQRSKSARQAIEVMTSLVKQYGYYSSGESFSIADPNEVWVLEMIGKGAVEKGAVWVAVRIPDDCIAAHANQSRIHRFPLKDKNNCIYSPDVISFARKQGYFAGKDDEFSFSAAYAPADFGSLRFCDARAWSFFNKYVDGMEQWLPYINGESKEPMPLYFKPKHKISLADMRKAMRDHFEGTPFDMTKDVGAGSYNVPYRWRPMTWKVDGKEYLHERAIATQQTAFTVIAQMRAHLPNEIGGVLWFGADDADMCVYTPLYACIKEAPLCYKEGNGSMLKFSWTSAFWIYNWVANMAYHKYSFMIDDIRKVQQEQEQLFDKTQSIIDKEALALYQSSKENAIQFLSDYSIKQANQTTERWKELGEFLMVKYVDGNIKQEQNGIFLDNGNGLPAKPQHPGYSEKYYRSIVDEQGDRLHTK